MCFYVICLIFMPILSNFMKFQPGNRAKKVTGPGWTNRARLLTSSQAVAFTMKRNSNALSLEMLKQLP